MKSKTDKIPSVSSIAAHPVAGVRGRTLWNAVIRLGSHLIAILANILITPYIIRNLGISAYGIVGVINTLIAFMTIASTSLIATVGRNLTFAVEQHGFERANKELSTAVFGLLGLFAILLPVLCGFALILDRIIVVPSELVASTRVLFVLASLSFAFSTISGPLGAAMFARNRLDMFSVAALGRTFFFISCVIVLFKFASATLTTYGIAILAGSLFLCLLHLQMHRYLLPGIEIARRWYDSAILREIVSLGGWMTVAQLGGLLFLQTDLLVANRVLGAAAAGQLAAISIISLQLRSLASLVSGLFAPTQAAIAARKDWPAFSSYLFRSIRVTTLFMALLTGVFCGSAKEVLSLWLGSEFASLAPVAVLLTAYLVVSLGVMPSWNAVLAIDKIKIPAVVTVIIGVGNVLLCIILANSMGLMGIALSGCIMLSIRNVLFTPWYVSRVCGIRLKAFLQELGIGLLAGIVVYLISALSVALLQPATLPMLGLSLVLAAGVGGLFILPLGLRAIRDRTV